MCGIIGHANRSEAFDRAFSLLSHRGPDGEGVANFGPVCFGHKRLAILDLSQRAAQPMLTTHGKMGIVFNGEIYNFAELRTDLEKEGVHFLTTGDTEVLLKGYEKHGVDFFKRLRGMWAFAIYDGRAGEKIVLARDPFGIKPLYYSLHGKGNTLVFASEIKSVVASVSSVRPHKKGYEWFFTYGYFLAPDTPYEEIHKVEPGAVLVYDIINKTLQNTLTVTLSLEGEPKDIKEAITDTIKAHYVSDVPVGVLFSGGADSSLIAAVSKEAGNNPTLFHVELPNSFDTQYAKKIADYLGLKMETLPLDRAVFAQRYDEIFTSIDEPSGDPSLFASHLLYSLVRGRAKVVLGGEGGDELFGGYYRHQYLYGRTLKNGFVSKAFESSIDFLPMEARKGVVNFFAKMRWPGLAFGYFAHTRMHPYQNIKSTVTDLNVKIFSKWEKEVSGLSHFLIPDLLSYLRSGLLYKGDISSMRYGIEARTPFLDRKFFASVVNNQEVVPSAPFQRKKKVKDLLAEYLPQNLIERPKSGFAPNLSLLGLDRYENDLKKAINYHVRSATVFGINPYLVKYLGSVQPGDLLNKYPRLAFALITNWRIHEGVWAL